MRLFAILILLAAAAPFVAARADIGQETDTALLRRGEIVFLLCRSCHTLDAGEGHLAGPNLNGLFGAAAGAKEGFAFSEALTRSGVVWSDETLNAWLRQPREFIPNNVMIFAGLPAATDRLALIAYLRRETR